MDPIKAAETPVPRGSVASKKRQLTEGRESPQTGAMKKPKIEPSQQTAMPYAAPQDHAQPEFSVHMHNGAAAPMGPSFQPNMMMSSSGPNGSVSAHDQPQIDPSLFSMYPEPPDANSSSVNGQPYHGLEKQELYNAYNLPSLEQIANEVLDMNGRHTDYDPSEQAFIQDERQYANNFLEATRHGQPMHLNGNAHSSLDKQDDSVDSAISMPTTEEFGPSQAQGPAVEGSSLATRSPTALHESNEKSLVDGKRMLPSPPPAPVMHHELPPQQPNLSTTETASLKQPQTSPTVIKNFINNIPLYQPPAPLAAKDASPLTTAIPPISPFAGDDKRKRMSVSSNADINAVKTTLANGVNYAVDDAAMKDEANLNLARMLQQEDLGLRRRSRS